MLPLNDLYNMDCMDGMRQFPDGYFDLAIVDPVYGDVTQGGYMEYNKGQYIGTGKARQKGYHAGLWNQEKSPPEYFAELRRVSKNLIIWGVITLLILCRRHNVGLSGINCIRKQSLLRTANLHGLHLILRREYSDTNGTALCSRT